MKCIFIDLETTGLDPENDDIIEIGALKVEDGDVTGSFSFLLHREGDLPDIITQITGITVDELRASVNEPAMVLQELQDFVGDLPLVGHNIEGFDAFFLQRYYRTYLGTELTNQLVDTLSASRIMEPFISAKRHKLSYLAEMIGVDVSYAHRALEDCYLTLSVAKAMWGENLDIPVLARVLAA